MCKRIDEVHSDKPQSINLQWMICFLWTYPAWRNCTRSITISVSVDFHWESKARCRMGAYIVCSVNQLRHGVGRKRHRNGFRWKRWQRWWRRAKWSSLKMQYKQGNMKILLWLSCLSSLHVLLTLWWARNKFKLPLVHQNQFQTHSQSMKPSFSPNRALQY